MKITLEITIPMAEKYASALRSVLDNCDVHSDDAVELEEICERIEFNLERWNDHYSDVECN